MDAWPLEKVDSVLRSQDSDIVSRMEALFHARHIGSVEALKVLIDALWHPSVLLKHEIAYVMGQMGHMEALPTLISLADDLSQDEMVRHEAGEAINALAAISDEALACVERHLNDESFPVRQTMQLAHFGILKRRSQNSTSAQPKKEHTNNSGFYILSRTNVSKDQNVVYANTSDPIEGEIASASREQINEWGDILKNESLPLNQRYYALFSLRNTNTLQAAKCIADALSEKSSALLRHEIAFVLGQMQYSETADALIRQLEATDDAPMARHEAAMSLGSVGSVTWNSHGRLTTPKVIEILKRFLSDSCAPVRESCMVALYNIKIETGLC